jgi:hypothetical protein
MKEGGIAPPSFPSFDFPTLRQIEQQNFSVLYSGEL